MRGLKSDACHAIFADPTLQIVPQSKITTQIGAGTGRIPTISRFILAIDVEPV
jgi:hypothetical protein